MMPRSFPKPSPRVILAGTIIASSLPFLTVILFPDQLHFVMDSTSYLLFHNIAEFFSIMVCLSIFGVGWNTYNQSKDRHALFLSAAFLSIGLMDFMHTMASAAMPAFITPNSTNKSAQFWIAARFFSALAFLFSAYIYKERHIGWLPKAVLSKTALMSVSLTIPALIFIGITFYPSHMPDTFIAGVGLTSFKVYSEYLIVCLLFLAAVAYWKRMKRSGDEMLMYYVLAFIICMFSELVFTEYTIDFDIHNVLGHTYKVVAFCLIYIGILISSVKNPYLALTDANAKLDREVVERRQTEEALRISKEELELRVEERTCELRDGNAQLQVELTERKKAEDALRQSEERYRALFNSMTEGFALHEVICDEKGDPCDYRFLDINPAFEKLTGLKRENVVGKTQQEILPDDDPRWVSAYGAVALTGEATQFENYSSALRRHYEVFAYRPEPGQFAVLFRDITERKQVEEERETARMEAVNEKKRLEVVMETLPVGVAIVDAGGGTVQGNHTFEQIWGGPRPVVGSVVDYTAFKAWWVDTGQTVEPEEWASARAVQKGETVVGQLLQIESFDGRRTFVHNSAAPIFGNNGQIIGAVVAIMDVTSQMEAEEALHKAHDELESRVQERTFQLSEAYENLQKEVDERQKIEDQFRQSQKLEAIGVLAGGVAHDFNNVLAGIIGFVEMVLDDIDPDGPEHRRLELVLKGAHRGRDLVKQILTFSRQTEQDREPVALSQTIEEGLKFLRPALPSTVQIVSRKLTDDDMILADPAQMHQILMNLCTNAAHAMRENGGSLHISVSKISLSKSDCVPVPEMKPGEYVVLEVRDTGCGMTAETLERMFDPFFTTKKQGEGTGLGLSVVHGILKSHGGYVAVNSEPGKGTEFKVYLPKINEPAVTEDIEVYTTAGNNERILVVDDEDILIELNTQRLNRLGYEVVATTSSVHALDLFRKEPDKFDLVLTDHTMPNLTGMDLAMELLKIKATIPIILCTGHSETVSPEQARDAGVKAFLMKPLAKQELAQVIRRLLDAKIEE